MVPGPVVAAHGSAAREPMSARRSSQRRSACRRRSVEDGKARHPGSRSARPRQPLAPAVRGCAPGWPRDCRWPEARSVGCDGQQGLGGRIEQQGVDLGLVVVGDGTDRRWQGEDDVVIVHRQQIGLARVQPTPCCSGLALRAMPVAARVVGDLILPAGFATQHVSPQRRAAALFDGRPTDRPTDRL